MTPLHLVEASRAWAAALLRGLRSTCEQRDTWHIMPHSHCRKLGSCACRQSHIEGINKGNGQSVGWAFGECCLATCRVHARLALVRHALHGKAVDGTGVMHGCLRRCVAACFSMPLHGQLLKDVRMQEALQPLAWP